MIIVTGSAGFIGSAIVHSLNVRGTDDILLVDRLDHPEKEKNVAALKYREMQSPEAFLENVRKRSLPKPEAIIHMGACSSTTETNEAFLRENNFEYTRYLAEYALEKGVRFIYASSAATYGDGSQGYADDEQGLDALQPLNLYGHSKHQFDVWARREGVLNRLVGLKYFNVYGPNEFHKGDMQSMVRKGYYQVKETGKFKLFKSYREEYADGGQERDFIYVADAVDMTLFFLDNKDAGGLFNVGSGVARNWNDMARSVFSALDMPVAIEYIEMPESIRNQYQYHTQAPMEKIRNAGYSARLMSLEDGVIDYVQSYLLPGRRLGD
ncbi:MAG: ADP-glyceromanno-heptose 6-epimerase [Candidatus Nitrohelix vancouverensis]|uniref:ADP-L-glycero-D-manno-heptose-6-epimerase n=1 Tax=Candidatus Nitrohelix vancouverensis TaxID=2705534 RepID=A0A7T0G206_9BACT|nr:MAG: ADP-glyceromanno-heptose 6-epimerase [Candidatus Nitrohelix vancouverensis]